MENIEIAETLVELADLLEIRGDNPFRVRAYRNAARTIRGLTRSLRQMVAEDEDLTELPGVGKDMAAHIRELVEERKLDLLEEVALEVPRELAVLTRLDGVGPRKARKLWETLGVVGIDDLEEALVKGRVEGLEGFGAKSVQKIRRSIQAYRERQGRFLRTDAEKYVEPLLEHLRADPRIRRLEVAGSYRRKKETVGDIDVLALLDAPEVDGSSPDPEVAARVMERFTTFEGVERVEMAGETRGSVVLRSGLPVDLRILPRRSYGAGLHYFTGSKEHNVAVRQLGVRRNLKISEYGVFRLENGADAEGSEGEAVGEALEAETEEQVFASVGLPFIPPELREDRGEVQAAGEGALPELVERSAVRGDLHMHSTWSDGRASIQEMAEACRERGYEYMALTDHSQAVRVAGGLTADDLRRQREEVEEAREAVEGIHILWGCEVDILRDGSLDLPDDVLEELDLVLVAVHSHMGLEAQEMTDRVLTALEHPEVDVLVHPTGRILNRRDPYAVDVEAVLQKARERDVAVELNANPLRLDLNDLHLKRAKELGLRISVATDAHRVGELDHMEPGIHQARRGWLEAGDVLNALPLDRLLRWLRRRDR